MMYLGLLTIHIVSSTVLFGTGLGIAFFLWMANRSGNRAAILVVTGHVIKADLWFTTPAVIIQPVSGFALMTFSGFRMTLSPLNWLSVSLLLYGVAGLCWLPVLWLQIRMYVIVRTGDLHLPLPETFWRYARIWTMLGIPAFLSLVVVFWLMVSKPF